MTPISTFQDLLVWQKAHNLVKEIYSITKNFPVEEKYILVSQMKRSAISVASNIVEGFRRRTKRDSLNFYNIAQGSLEELRYQIILSRELGLISEESSKKINDSLEETARLLQGWIKSNRQKILGPF